MIEIHEDEIVVRDDRGHETRFGLGTPEGFKILSDLWLRSGWDTKYVYSFTWLGRPIIQLPDDLVRIQEVIFSVQPDVIVETGIAHGGGLVFYAGLCRAMDRGRVIGIDIEIRPHNRRAIEEHFLFPWIDLIEGDSIAPKTVAQVEERIGPDERVMVLLDSRHTRDHVLGELRAYGPFVSVGSYAVAMDGIMANLAGAPRSEPDWSWNNPLSAAREFAEHNPDFVIEEPAFPFNEGTVTDRVTYWPGGFLKRVR
ncbi:MAG: cephalosporin hydroxylase family protein [Planctomycetota bacterium]